MQLFCTKIAILASGDKADSTSLRISFQRVFQKKEVGKKGASSTKTQTEGPKVTSLQSKTGKVSSGVGPLIVEPPTNTPPKKMKQTVR